MERMLMRWGGPGAQCGKIMNVSECDGLQAGRLTDKTRGSPCPRTRKRRGLNFCHTLEHAQS